MVPFPPADPRVQEGNTKRVPECGGVNDCQQTLQAAGFIEGEQVPGYDEEIGRDSHTETFVAIKASVDNWRWKGVPFYLRTGKRLASRDARIEVNFRPTPHAIFSSPSGAVIAIRDAPRLFSTS